MAKADKQKLREKSEDELSKDVRREEQRLQELRFDLARGKVKNSDLVRKSRKDIAQLKTFIKEKEKTKEPVIKNDGE